MARKSSSVGETVLITGASAGIGAALAEQFAAQGYNLIVVARSEDKLQHLANKLGKRHGVTVTVVACDLLKRGASNRLFSTVSELGLVVDILVNNAGLMAFGDFMEQDLNEINSLLQLNNQVLVNVTQLFAEPMLKRGRGRILNIASTAAFQPVPTLAVYAASKAFVLSLSEALHEEFRPHGVTVTAFCPGFTDTGMIRGIDKLPAVVIADVDEVAAKGLQACLKGVAVSVPGRANQFIATAGRYQPRAVVRRMVGLSTRWLGN